MDSTGCEGWQVLVRWLVSDTRLLLGLCVTFKLRKSSPPHSILLSFCVKIGKLTFCRTFWQESLDSFFSFGTVKTQTSSFTISSVKHQISFLKTCISLTCILRCNKKKGKKRWRARSLHLHLKVKETEQRSSVDSTLLLSHKTTACCNSSVTRCLFYSFKLSSLFSSFKLDCFYDLRRLYCLRYFFNSIPIKWDQKLILHGSPEQENSFKNRESVKQINTCLTKTPLIDILKS